MSKKPYEKNLLPGLVAREWDRTKTSSGLLVLKVRVGSHADRMTDYTGATLRGTFTEQEKPCRICYEITGKGKAFSGRDGHEYRYAYYIERIIYPQEEVPGVDVNEMMAKGVPPSEAAQDATAAVAEKAAVTAQLLGLPALKAKSSAQLAYAERIREWAIKNKPSKTVSRQAKTATTAKFWIERYKNDFKGGAR